jgi:hypothetical protein
MLLALHSGGGSDAQWRPPTRLHSNSDSHAPLDVGEEPLLALALLDDLELRLVTTALVSHRFGQPLGVPSGCRVGGYERGRAVGGSHRHRAGVVE